MPVGSGAARAAILALCLALVAGGPGPAALAQQTQEKKERQPSDLEKGLLLFQSGLKVYQAFRPIKKEEESAIGHEVAREVFLRYGRRVEDEGLNRYVNLVGRTVASRSGRSGEGFRFAVIENNEANAFAAPGGYVFVTTGLLGKLSSEAQLAGVLGHEVAHITKRHMIETLERSKKLAGAVELSSTLLNKDKAALSKVVGITTEILFTTGLDQKLEYEADAVGVSYAASAGYQAGGLNEFLKHLKASEGREGSVFFQTHPPTSGRINRLERSILPRYGPSGVSLNGRYASFVK